MKRLGWTMGALAFTMATMFGCAATQRHDGLAESVDRHAASPQFTDATTPNDASNAALLRTVQHTLNDKGFDAGPVDGRWGTGIDLALRRFQLAQRLPPTGDLDSETLSALGVAPADGAPSMTDAQPLVTSGPDAMANGATTRALPAPGSTPNAVKLPPPMTPTGTTPAGMTTPGATPSGVTTRPAAGTPPEQNSGTPQRTGTP